MKKTVCIVLAVALVATGFAACQKSKNENGSTVPSGAGTSSSTSVQSTTPASKQTSSTVNANQDATKGSEEGRTAAQAMTPNGKKYISITFDDGPGPYTQELLDGLKERGVKAAFFMLGQQVKLYPNTVKRIAAEGHMVGSHTYDHKDLKKMTDAQVKKELDDTDAAIKAAAGVTASALRPPFGSYTKEQMKKVDKMIVLWNVDPNDWKDRNAQTVCDRIVRDAKNGAIILSHDIYKTSVHGVLKAIDILQKQGYVFVRPDELVQRSGSSVVLGKPYYNAVPAAATTHTTKRSSAA